MRILVIGGTNFIGPHVVNLLNRADHEVTVFHRGPKRANLPEDVDHILGDRGNLPEFMERLERLSPEVVLDMIPMNERDAKTLVDTFGNVAERVVAISSQDVYRAYDIVRRKRPGPPDPVPLAEDAPLREELYPYDREGVKEYEKILVERVVMEESALSGTVLRLPMVYGPGDYRHRLFPYLKRMDDGRPAIILEKGLARWRWTRGYVEDVDAAIVLAVTDERAAGRTYNVGELETESYAEWIHEVGRVVGWEGEIIEVPIESTPEDVKLGGNFDQHLVTNTGRIRRELDYREAVPQKKALSRTVEWELVNPPEDIEPKAFDYDAEDAILCKMN